MQDSLLGTMASRYIFQKIADNFINEASKKFCREHRPLAEPPVHALLCLSNQALNEVILDADRAAKTS